MNEKIEVIRCLIERTQDDFTSYHEQTIHEKIAGQIASYALSLNPMLASLEEPLGQMLPDTEDDGRWQASYALNTGSMILSLIDAMRGNVSAAYEESVILFFDTVDFKVQEMLDEGGIAEPSEEQIANHQLMQRERLWFTKLLAGKCGPRPTSRSR